jgi:hypothetical protein
MKKRKGLTAALSGPRGIVKKLVAYFFQGDKWRTVKSVGKRGRKNGRA